MQNTCASKCYKDIKSPYDAHVIEKIKNEDGIILGKVNMDEFAMGSSTENSAYKLTKKSLGFRKSTWLVLQVDPQQQ